MKKIMGIVFVGMVQSVASVIAGVLGLLGLASILAGSYSTAVALILGAIAILPAIAWIDSEMKRMVN